jgi:hypothetical protein
VTEPRRVLVDWDWGASGIWRVSTREDLLAAPPAGTWTGTPPAPAARLRAWSDLLSDELLDDLQQWNDDYGRAERRAILGSDQPAALMERGRLLAIRVQSELGTEDWEVLYRSGATIYRVHPPGSWPVESWRQELLGYPPRKRPPDDLIPPAP